MRTQISRLYLAAFLQVFIISQIAWIALASCGNDNAGSPLFLKCTFPVLLLTGTLLHLGRLPTVRSAMHGLSVIVLSFLPILLIGWLVRRLGDANGVVSLSLLPIIIGAPMLALVYVCTLPWVIRRTDLLDRCRNHLRRFAPFYLIAGPPALTYVALCGTLSAWATIFWITKHPYQGHEAISHRDAIIQSGIFTMLHAVEWACSLVGAFGFAWLLRWLDLPRFWFFILLLSLSISAAYRTARLDPGPHFGTGPGILFTPEYGDIVPVILGLVLFAIHQRYLARKSPPPEVRAARNGLSS